MEIRKKNYYYQTKYLTFSEGVFNLLYHATPLTYFGMLATPHNDNVKIELRR